MPLTKLTGRLSGLERRFQIKKMTQKQDSSCSKSQKTETFLIAITGIVQGVGFRPFIWLAAEKLMISGSVANTTGGVIIKINSCDEERVLQFVEYIKKNKPSAALIEHIKYGRIPFETFNGFSIDKSCHIENTYTLVSPDISTCDKCIRDINDPKNSRRFNYPFTNCTNCGPRFTIIENMPYDRPNTTMKRFIQCPECSAEYLDPRDRRFHAQPNACSICGPVLKLLSSRGRIIKTAAPIANAAKLLQQGFIVGIKSLGGFQIACDATNAAAVAELRKRKKRPAKPFALMFKDTASIANIYDLSNPEKESLNSAAAPIVLLKKKAPEYAGQIIENHVSPEISFNNKYEGIMLPYTPLHHLLFKHINIPLVMTSGNISEEPIAYKNSEAVSRLGDICDYFLINDRDIFSRYDDSVVRIFDDKEMIIRRARGYAPYPVKTDIDIGNRVVLSVGAQEKNTFCLQTSNHAFVSQHIGDLDTAASSDFFIQTLKNYKKIFSIKKIDIVVSDKHPDYISTKFAKEHLKSAKKIQIQHHEAHIASVIAENNLLESLAAESSECKNQEALAAKASECVNTINKIFKKKTEKFSPITKDANLSRKNSPDAAVILGFAWDGTGYGNDGKIWGSEVLAIDGSFNFNRLGSLREKCMPGGEITIKKPYRMAFSYLYNAWKANNSQNNPTGLADFIFKNFPFYKDISSENEITILRNQIVTGFNSPITTSMGRFFDAVSSLLDISHIASYEGEAAIKLEMAADLNCDLEYDLQYLNKPGFYDNNPFVLDDYHILMQILKDIIKKVGPPIISAKFHNSLARAVLLISLGVQQKYKIQSVALSGGVFQNNLLLEKSFKLLKMHGFKPYSNFKVPVNDGGISLGQAYYGAWKVNQKDKNK
jgi:hydrogenase maturation protein HypF